VDQDKCNGKDKCTFSAPCHIACPAKIDPESYISLIAEGKFKEAITLFREISPFAGVLGRVCTHPCEIDCQRGKYDESISICSLKRSMADHEFRIGREKARRIIINKTDKIAIIGSGPAGLSCAYDLIRKGYPVTVFEATAQSGGLLRYGIPGYRLPKEVLDNEINYVKELGIEIKTNCPVKNVEDIFQQGYKAIFIATGAWRSLKLGVAGEQALGVVYALDLLRRINSGEKVTFDKRVVVIGGGSVAIDAARSSVRLGAQEVHLVCLECRDLSDKDGMPAQVGEIAQAEQEGVIIHPSLGIRRVLTEEGRAIGVETMICTSVREADGTFAPKFAECSSPTILGDNIIVAIGQAVDHSSSPSGVEYTGRGLSIDPLTFETSRKGIFAGGDVVESNGSVINAIASGKKAAISIMRYLNGEDLKHQQETTPEQLQWVSYTDIINQPRKVPPTMAIENRRNFTEVDLELDEEMSIDEARRCLKCGKCSKACPYGSPQFGMGKNAKMQKCDLCIERWQEGKQPICVASCPTRALDAGPIDEMRAKYSDVRAATGFIYNKELEPSIIYKPKLQP
jgi:heterodisulfide reductase subunit A